MSGEVQPRKRKDKRRRRDDEDDSTGVPLSRSSSTEYSDNVTIHVYKETGTGGHWCAKIVFFGLLATLLTVVGLIIVEHRGTTEVDTPVTSSQWAMIFEGWVDDNTGTFEDRQEPAEEEEKSQDEDTDENDIGDEIFREQIMDEYGQSGLNKQEKEKQDKAEEREHSDYEEREDEEDENTQADDETQFDDKNVEPESGKDGLEELDDKEYFKEQKRSNGEKSDRDKTMSEEEFDESLGINDEEDSKEENDEEISDNDIDSNGDNFDFEDGFDSVEQQVDYASAEKENRYNFEDVGSNEDYSQENFNNFDDNLEAFEEVEDTHEDDQIPEAFDSDSDLNIKGVTPNDEDDQRDYVSNGEFTIAGVNEINESSEVPFEEVDAEELEEVTNNSIELDEEMKIEKELEEESTSIAMKFGVGIALIVTAHFILIRRWNSGK